MSDGGVVGVTTGVNQLSNFEPGCESGWGGDVLETVPDILIRDGAHGGELVTAEGEVCAISGGMTGMGCDVPREGLITNGDGPTGIGIKAIDLGEGGGLIGAQRIELSEEEETGSIADVGVVSGRVLSGAVFVNEAGGEQSSLEIEIADFADF